MTTTVGAYEAKTHLPRLLEQVERGETITITKHGREVAKLVPVVALPANPDEVIAALRKARVGVRRGRTSIRRMIDEGRR
jgi:prevent-host-death family protein